MRALINDCRALAAMLERVKEVPASEENCRLSVFSIDKVQQIVDSLISKFRRLSVVFGQDFGNRVLGSL